jgi:hypothetical protein
LADHDLSITTEAKNFLRRVVQVINYHAWHNLATVKGDFVLVKLDRPVEFSRIASPICLPPDPSQTFSREIATSIGWGITEDGKPSKYLREVKLLTDELYKHCLIKYVRDVILITYQLKTTVT